MIVSLQFVDCKNLAAKTRRVSPFSVILGINASGKHNIRDAFR